ncbi:Protein tyrosine phosphatase type IVA 1 [Entophlyctis sp. JEL0112]|nr:Protein tyrosine phosphatase type IVA 1 [Entophlyctis sp. JEL0112]
MHPSPAAGPKHTLIEHERMPVRILITDCPPSEDMLREAYLPVFEELRVSHLVRLCEPTYSTAPLDAAGVRVIDSYAFADGSAPSSEVVTAYRAFIDSLLSSAASSPSAVKPTVAVHCVSGIGRAPIFAVIPLIDAGLDRADAVEFVRRRRRGAFNRVQIAWIMDERDGLPPRDRRRTGGGVTGSFKMFSGSAATPGERAGSVVSMAPSVASSRGGGGGGSDRPRSSPGGFLGGLFGRKRQQ